MQLDLARQNTELIRTWGITIDDIDLSAHFSPAWSATHDADAAFSAGTFPVARPFTLSEGRHTIRLRCGWSGSQDLAFSGEITATQETLYRRSSTITAGGFLKRLEAGIDQAHAFYYAGGSAEDTAALLEQISPDYLPIPIQTDADIIIKILELYGITPETSGHSIEASAWTPAKIEPIYWEPGTPGWTLISEIDTITTYRTFDGRTGAIYRRQILGTVPSSTRTTLQQGRDLLSLELARDFRIFNQCIVRGAQNISTGEQIEGVAPNTGPQPSPYIPNPPGVRTDEEINSALIETVEDAEALADIRLGWLKQPLQTFDAATFGASDLDVGDAVSIDSDLISTNAFIVAHTISAKPYRSALRLRGSTVAEARPNLPPTPALTITTGQEQVLVAGTPTDLTLITIDATSSSDSDGTIAAYSIQIDGQTYNLPKLTHPHVGPPPATVTLTVTDAEGQAASLTQTVTWEPSQRIVEPIHAAEETQAEASVDGERTWNSFAAPVTAVAPIALGEATIYGCSDGTLYRSLDELKTAPTLVTTLPSAINCVWNNEKLPNRWLAGLQNGQVWISLDSGQTWSLLYTFDAAVTDLSESPYAANNMSATSGQSMWTTFDGLNWTPTITGTGLALRFAAGPHAGGRAWCGFGNGQVIGSDGTVIMLPEMAAVRGLTLAIAYDALFIFTDSTKTYIWTPEAGLTTGPTTGSATNRAIRSGFADFTYTSEDGAIGKWFPTGQRFDVRRMTSPARALAVGYRPTSRPTLLLGEAEIIRPTSAAVPGGVWHWTPNAPPTLKNNGLPSGWNWYSIEADKTNPDRWLLTGSPASSSAAAFEGGTLTTTSGASSPLWYTSDAGATWQAVALSGPYASGATDARNLRATFDPDHAGHLIAAISAERFVSPGFELYTVAWWGNPTALAEGRALNPSTGNVRGINAYSAGQNGELAVIGRFGENAWTFGHLGYDSPTAYGRGAIPINADIIEQYSIERAAGTDRLVAAVRVPGFLGTGTTIYVANNYSADNLVRSNMDGAWTITSTSDGTCWTLSQDRETVVLWSNVTTNPQRSTRTPIAYPSAGRARTLRADRQTRSQVLLTTNDNYQAVYRNQAWTFLAPLAPDEQATLASAADILVRS